VRLWQPQTKRTQQIGHFSSEEDAARAYDYAAVQAHGQSAKRNFPSETIGEAPETVGEQQKQQARATRASAGTSAGLHGTRGCMTRRHLGKQHIGRFASEEDAARAYDCAAVQAHGPGAERNFPGEAISELPA
jgi:AP2-like factor (euAP2 lineage)